MYCLGFDFSILVLISPLFLHNLTAHKVGFRICLSEGQARRICIVEVCKDKMHQGWKHGRGGADIIETRALICFVWEYGEVLPVEETHFFMVYFVLFGAYSTWNDRSAFILADNVKVDWLGGETKSTHPNLRNFFLNRRFHFANGCIFMHLEVVKL